MTTVASFAMRELRGGVRGFAVFILCIALGVMAISGVGSFARSLTDGLAREGQVILGGDAAFSLFHREAGQEERAFLESRGRVSAVATMRAMTRAAGDRLALVELKAVDGAYPLYGEMRLEPAMTLGDALAQRDGAFGAAVDSALLSRLGLNQGGRLQLGSATLEIRAVIETEPDRLAGGIDFGPRVIISDAALRATGLVKPGSLVRWHYRVALPGGGEGQARALVDDALRTFPDAGWTTRTRNNASPGLARNVERFTQFLTLVGLTALLVGGVGVANSVKGYLDRRRGTIATLKSLGATGGRVFAIYLVQVLVLALIGALIGMVLGAALPFAIAAVFGHLLPLPIEPGIQPYELGLALLYGLMTALAFALWPLGRAHDVPVSALFREAVAPERRWPRLRYMLATAAVVALLATFAIYLAYDRRIATIFVGAAVAVFVALYLVALGVMAVARRLPHARSTALRLAIANIHRPGALTPAVILSLGLGLALLVTVVQIDGNLRNQFLAAMPDRAPSFFFVDIQANEADRFDAFVRARAPDGDLERVPMLRGRISAVNGVRAEEVKVQPDVAWALRGDRGITYATRIPEGSRLVEGEWWGPDYKGPPLVSMEKRVADGLGLGIGDAITVNVLGRNIEATVGNLRTLDWESLGINFVLVFSPGTFVGAPHTHLATLTYPGNPATQAQENALIREVSADFPSITTVSVRSALESIAGVVTNMVAAIRGASVVALVSAVLVLGGALAAGHRGRVYDAVILKTLGATRRRLVGAYALEYLLLGTVTALFGVAAGSAAAWMVVTNVMNLSFTWLPGPALSAAFGALALTVVFGLIGTYTALGHKPAPVLRNL